MKHLNNNRLVQEQHQQQAEALRHSASAALTENKNGFSPSADEVARRAYFCYENEGSKPGREVQHWLTAEAELIAERNLTRVHGVPHKT